MDVLTIIFYVLFVAIAVNMANNRGRSPWTWGIIAVLIPIVSIVGLLIAGKTKEKKAEELKELKELIKD